MAELIRENIASRIMTERDVDAKLAAFGGGTCPQPPGDGGGVLLAKAEYTPSGTTVTNPEDYECFTEFGEALQNIQPMTFNPIVKILDHTGQPTDETIQLDHVVDIYNIGITLKQP